jgi:hypothetical protein
VTIGERKRPAAQFARSTVSAIGRTRRSVRGSCAFRPRRDKARNRRPPDMRQEVTEDTSGKSDLTNVNSVGRLSDTSGECPGAIVFEPLSSLGYRVEAYSSHGPFGDRGLAGART